jgi:hypothetical protein
LVTPSWYFFGATEVYRAGTDTKTIVAERLAVIAAAAMPITSLSCG